MLRMGKYIKKSLTEFALIIYFCKKYIDELPENILFVI